MNINLSTSEPPFVFQISQSSNIGQKWFCIQNLQMDFSFQEKKTVCKSVKCFTSYSNSCDTGEFMRFFKHPVLNSSLAKFMLVNQSKQVFIIKTRKV